MSEYTLMLQRSKFVHPHGQEACSAENIVVILFAHSRFLAAPAWFSGAL